MKEFDPSRYNAKYEQKYFYLPRIIRKGSLSYKDLYKNKSVRIIILIITLTLKNRMSIYLILYMKQMIKFLKIKKN